MEQIKSIFLKNDMRLFSSYLDNMNGDLNRYILIENDNGTKLNLLHILSGLEPSTAFLEKCIRELLKRPNADVNATAVIDNNYGITAAHIAVQWHHVSILKILVDFTPDLLKCDSFGKTVQDYAEKERNGEMIKIVEKGIEKWYNLNYDQYESILNTFRKSSNRSSFSSGNEDVISVVEEDFNDWYFPNHNQNEPILKTHIQTFSKRNSVGETNHKVVSTSEKGFEKYCFNNQDQNETVFKTPMQMSSNRKFSSSERNGKVLNLSKEDIKKCSFNNEDLNETIFQTPMQMSNKSPSVNDRKDQVCNVSEEGVTNWCLDNQDPNETIFQTPMKIAPTTNQSLITISDSSIQPMNNSNQSNHLLSNVRLSAGSGISYLPSINSSLDSLASEVYLYKDEAYNVQFLEERFNGAPRLIDEQRKAESNRSEFSSPNGSGNASSSFNRSTESVESTIDELILKMTNTQLFDHLVEKGEKPGPVNERTKRLYQRKANRLKNQGQASHSSFLNEINSVWLRKTMVEEVTTQEDKETEKLMEKLASYPLEFTNLVKRKFPFEEAIKYENMLIKKFDEIESRYEDGIHGGSSAKNTYFSYLLLDPAITDNLPVRANMCLEMLIGGCGDRSNGRPSGLLELLDPKLFAAFILAIFYVGKGCNARAYAHFYEAYKAMDPAFNKGPRATGSAPSSAKVEKICSIWRTGKGPISLHCFQGISEDEALTREALMIDVLSLSNLTNSISGSYRCDLELNKRARNILGTYLLFKAFIILLLNGERQVKMPEKR